jgi:hypothetical protein
MGTGWKDLYLTRVAVVIPLPDAAYAGGLARALVPIVEVPVNTARTTWNVPDIVPLVLRGGF